VAAAVPGTRHEIVPHAGHMVQRDRPDLVTAAVLDVVERARVAAAAGWAASGPASGSISSACRNRAGPECHSHTRPDVGQEV